MNLWLKSYVGVAPLPDGVYIEAGQRSFVLKGANLFPVVAKLLKAFDGTQPLSVIENALPENARPLLQKLVSELRRHDMVQPLERTNRDELPSWQRDLYRRTLHFYQNETPAAAACFETFRSTALTVAGSGHSYASLVRSLLTAGVRELHLVLEPGADETSLVEFVARHVEAHANLDPELSVHWHAAAEFHGLPLEGTAQVLYVHDALPFDDVSSLLSRLIRNAAPGTLIGGVLNGRGLVGPQTGKDRMLLSNTWARLPAVAPYLPFSATTCSVIGALLAFQIIKQPLYRLNGDLAHWPELNLFHVSATGAVSAHPVLPQTQAEPRAKNREPAQQRMSREEWFVAERRRLERRMSMAFDPLTGVLAWAEDGGSEFPLPHRSLRVKLGAPTAEPLLLTEWGLTQQDVGLRALCTAVATVIELTPELARQLDNECTVAADRDQWRRMALAKAIVHSALFENAHPHSIEPASISDSGFKMLARLVRLYRRKMPRISVSRIPGLPAFVAEVAVDDHRTHAIGDTLLTAVTEAAGLLVSACQRPWQGEVRVRTARRSGRPDRPEIHAVAIKAMPAPGDALAGNPARNLADFGFRAIEQIIDPEMFRGSGLTIGAICVVPDPG